MTITAASEMVFKTIVSSKDGKLILEAILKNVFKKKVIIKRYLKVELPMEVKGKRLYLLIETSIGFINIKVNKNDYNKERIVRNFKHFCELLDQNIIREWNNLDTDYIQLNINFGNNMMSNYTITNGEFIDEEKTSKKNFKILNLSMTNLCRLCCNDHELISKYRYILMLNKTVDELVDFYPDDEIVGLYGGELMRLSANASFVRMLANEE